MGNCVWNICWKEVLSKLKPIILFSLICTYIFIDYYNIYSFYFNIPSAICTNNDLLDIFQILLFFIFVTFAFISYTCNYWIEDISVESYLKSLEQYHKCILAKFLFHLATEHEAKAKLCIFPHKFSFDFQFLGLSYVGSGVGLYDTCGSLPLRRFYNFICGFIEIPGTYGIIHSVLYNKKILTIICINQET